MFFYQPLAAASQGSDLCPIATKRLNRSVGLGNSKKVLSAPTSAEETTELMNTLRTGTGDSRHHAIMRLGLAGNLDAFRVLLAGKDIDGLYLYSSRYLNSDDTVCIDPELERALLEHLHQPELGRRLVALLGHNTYRSKAVLSALSEIPFDPEHAPQWVAFARSITATHLPNIESQVMAYARGLLPFETPVEKSVLPGLHRHYVQFFTKRRYTPAVVYFQELLQQASREEPVQSFQIEYGMLRTVVQRGLATLGDTQADTTLIAELEAIVSKPLDPFAYNELYNICQLAPELKDPRDRDAVVDLLERVLSTPQPPKYDHRMRRTVYESLAKLDTPRSEALLMAELERYVGHDPPPNGEFMVAKLFEALTQVEDLDTTPVLALVDDLKPAHRRRILWHLVSIHPSEAGVDFLLKELRLSYSANAEVRQLQGPEASAGLLKTLVAFETAQYQNLARDGIDALFDEGVLPAEDYGLAVTKLNQALGNESPRYIAFREEQARRRAEQQAARRERAEAEAREALQASHEEELTRQSSAEGIARNVALLANFGGAAKRALQWLVIVGEPALPQLHAALAEPDASDRHKVQLMNAIGEIGSPDSTGHLIQAAETGAHDGFYRSAFFALALIPPTPEAIAFAETQLADGVPELRQVAALVYFAQIRHPPAASLVTQLTREDRTMRVRSAGFYLGAQLGVPGITAPIAQALTQTTDRSELAALLQSLAASAENQTEFERFATAAGFDERSTRYRQNLAYCAFRTAPPVQSGEQKRELAYRVLADGVTWHRREAMRYLIATDPQGTVQRLTGGIGQFMPLHTLLAQSSGVQLLFSEGRRTGYRLRHSDKGYVLAKH